MTPRVQRIALWVGFGFLVAVSAYGFSAEGLFAQPVWDWTGLQRLLLFVAVFAGFFLAIVAWRPGWVAPLSFLAALVYTAATAGPLALLAVLFFLFSCFALGRLLLGRHAETALDDLLALLAGASVYVWLVGLAVHLPVNYPTIYLAGLAVPILLRPRNTAACLRRCASLFRPVALGRRSEYALLAIALFVLAAHWLAALKPEVSADGLAMHLVAPSSVAVHHQWGFDFRNLAWAVMPMNADWGNTAVYLLGGEYAARLLNFSLLGLLVALLYLAARRWLAVGPALLVVALFASSPIVQLETGALLAENLWAALVLGGVLALWRYRESGAAAWLWAAAALAGAAVATKYGALAMVVPVAVFALVEVWRRRRAGAVTGGLLALACFFAFAAPPYVTAYLKTGNPVFPFLNAVFKSPYFDSTASLVDPRFTSSLGLDALYQLTFASHRFLESQDGALGFHYLLLVPLSLVLLRREWPYLGWVALAVSAAAFAFTFPFQAYLRYLYPALPLLMIPIALMLARLPALDRRFNRAVWVAALAALLVNIYFLPASNWYHKDFCLNPLRWREEAQRYIDYHAPRRKLVEYLNRTHPGAPVLFVESNQIAGLNGPAYSTFWHSEAFLQRLRTAGSALDCLRLMSDLGIRFFVVPAQESGVVISYVPLEAFLDQFVVPEHAHRGVHVGRLREAPRPTVVMPPAGAGSYDDTSPQISYSGPWMRGTGFPRAAGGSITHTNTPGATFRLAFTGTRVTYVYTKAFNRGMAEVILDDVSRGTLDLYSRATSWQARATFDGLAPGSHALEVRVLPRKNAASSDYYVDLDRLIVE